MNRLISGVKRTMVQHLINMHGWRTKYKILVIESDDWGSIRMPSKEVYIRLIERGLDLSGSSYNRLDTIENNEDLTSLFEVLQSFNDSVGNPPIVTANMIVGNPDFRKIEESEFIKYFYEPVTETLKKYKGRDNVELLWKQGNSAGIFRPQFHGREHVNIVRWMDALLKKTPEIVFSFGNGTTFSGKGDYNFMEVLDYDSISDLEIMKQSLIEGMDIFEDIFGYRSVSFVPACYTWDSKIEEVLHIGGVKYIQGLFVQSVPTGTFGVYKKKYHPLGSRNNNGQIYLTRNCFFEPSFPGISDPVSNCLKQINTAFRWRKPAIISSHRINYIGSLDELNRTKNLHFLKDLLNKVISIWPDVIFMSSDQLGKVIADTGGRL